MSRATDTYGLLSVLDRHRVDFIVVGMTAGVLQGAPLLTFDLDIVYSRDPANLVRLLAALAEVEATFRGDPRRIAPNVSHLESLGHKLLETTMGDLDVLGAIDEGAVYQGLLADTVILQTGDLDVRVLALKRLIDVKRRAGRPKDLAALPVLESTLERASRRGGT
jgi:hypothetical protein